MSDLDDEAGEELSVFTSPRASLWCVASLLAVAGTTAGADIPLSAPVGGPDHRFPERTLGLRPSSTSTGHTLTTLGCMIRGESRRVRS